MSKRKPTMESRAPRSRSSSTASSAPRHPTRDSSAEVSGHHFHREVLPLQDELMAVAMRYTRNRADAEDLVQDTLVRAYAAWDRFQPGTNCRAWMFRILTNSFINGYRRKKRHRRFTDENAEDGTVAIHGDPRTKAAPASAELVDNTLGDEVSAALSTLVDDYRQVVERADLDGHRYKDIAKDLGVPIGTVMSRLFRARRQLETLLKEYAAADYGIRRVAA